MAVKYHINQETGRPNICRADKGPCPVGGQHFEDKAEAKKAGEALMADQHDAFSTLSKKKPTAVAPKNGASVATHAGVQAITDRINQEVGKNDIEHYKKIASNVEGVSRADIDAAHEIIDKAFAGQPEKLYRADLAGSYLSVAATRLRIAEAAEADAPTEDNFDGDVDTLDSIPVEPPVTALEDDSIKVTASEREAFKRTMTYDEDADAAGIELEELDKGFENGIGYDTEMDYYIDEYGDEQEYDNPTGDVLPIDRQLLVDAYYREVAVRNATPADAKQAKKVIEKVFEKHDLFEPYNYTPIIEQDDYDLDYVDGFACHADTEAVVRDLKKIFNS